MLRVYLHSISNKFVIAIAQHARCVRAGRRIVVYTHTVLGSLVRMFPRLELRIRLRLSEIRPLEFGGCNVPANLLVSIFTVNALSELSLSGVWKIKP
jgi:hypothetical protein